MVEQIAKTQRNRSVTEAISELSENMDILEKTIVSLTEVLGPVQLKGPQSPAKDENVEMAPRSEVADRLYTEVNRVKRDINALNAIMGSLNI